MGYCMDQQDSKFTIKQENIGKALAAVKALSGKETIKDSSGRHFSWVDQDFATKNTLEEILASWRWQIKVLGDDVIEIEFTGEKLGDDKILFDAIAPYVEKGSFIEMHGEDGARWKWVFNGKTCEEKIGRVVYE